ncbi:SF3a splicing factor complex subunit [Tulasnella sp. 418]|nr:SF3a splicing factor complex subunit [Tulasnella sp. 418]
MSVEVANPPSLANGHAGTVNGDNSQTQNGSSAPSASKYIAGLIYPPPDIRTIIDRTAAFVARSANPPQFEEKIREKHRQDPKFSFVNSSDPYHAYYRHKIQRIQEGEEDEVGEAAKKDGEAGQSEPEIVFTKGKEIPKEPPPPEFTLDKPHISALDLDILKLTALFTARQGHSFLATLSAREGRNYQFDFLRPTHSLFGFFNRMVDQYTKVLIPPPEALERLEELKGEGGRWKLLEQARERAEWEAYRRQKQKSQDDNREAERRAFAEIDWHDFAIVQTIEFTVADSQAELPPPMSIAEIENMTLAQKKMAAMITETTAPEVEAIRAQQEAAAAAAAAARENDTQMEVESDHEDIDVRKEARKKEMEELERAKAIQAQALSQGAPMKIRKDYVPKSLAAKNAGKVMTTLCTICGQSVPIDELEEHMRIELLDPRWKTQRDALEARRATANEQQLGANVVTSLKQLARVFGDDESDEAARKKIEAEAEARRKEREKVAWDGHTASKAGVVDKFQSNVNFEEQIASIWKAKGLGGTDPAATGPGIGPSIGPSTLPANPTSAMPLPASLPPNPLTLDPTKGSAYASATVSSGPQPASQMNPYSTFAPHPSLPPIPAFGPGAPYGAGAPGDGMGGMHPSRMAALATGGPMMAGTIRSADEMNGGDGAPPPKRPRVAKLPEGQYYTELDWQNTHPDPISLSVRLPSQDTSEVSLKPEWNLDGAVVTVPDLPVTLLISTLRDRILSQISSTLAASRVKLSYGNKVLTNSMSLATYNLDDGDLIVLSVRDAKKKN